MDSQRKVQPSALHYSPTLQRRDLSPLVLADCAAEGRAADGVAEFAITTPEVRCRIKGVIRWVPSAANPLTRPDDYHYMSGAPPLPTSRFAGTGLWLAKRDDVDLGGRGMAPVENLLGDIYTPWLVDRGCLGILFEAETAAMELWGRFYVDLGGFPGPGAWVLKAAANAVEPMNDTEWARVSSRFAIRGQGIRLSPPAP